MTRFTVERPDDYSIGAATDFNGDEYVYLEHKPCGHWIYGGMDDPHTLGLYGMFKAIDDHYCQAPAVEPTWFAHLESGA